MKEFFSFSHIAYMVIVAFVFVAIYFLIKNKSARTQKIVIFTLMLLNLLQHLLKIYVYPQYWGQSFGALSTAYNMCALLIIITPFIFLFGTELWKNFITYIGTVAGLLSIFVTYWLAEPIEGQIRFVLCHALLLYTSLLPALLGIYKINYRKFWKLPFVFYSCLIIIVMNDIITYSLGIVGEISSASTLHQFLIQQNPCWVMKPAEGYDAVADLIKIFTPQIFEDIPLLWYAIPLFMLISLGSLGLGAIFDNERFVSDLKAAREYITQLFLKIKTKFNKEK